MLKKLTRYLISKNKDIENEIFENHIEEYLNKKVISVNINEFMQPEKSGERVLLQDVIMYNSVISHSQIDTERVMLLGSNNILTGNYITTK